MAITILIVCISLYFAWRWFKGANTVPVPSYISGFTSMEMPRTAPGVKQNASEASEFFMNPASGSQKKQEPFVGGPMGGPLISRTLDASGNAEGFYGGAVRGTGSPDCLRTSSEGAALVAMFQCDAAAESDHHELSQIVGKLSCFKKDLMSTAFVVDATRKQEFVTMHDIEPIGETTGRCFAKTISPRDLELSFDKWTQRGELLVNRLSAADKLSPADADKAMSLFRAVVRDVKDVARGACFVGEPMIAGKPGPRDPHPFESPDLKDLGTYSGYY